jgi:hypothetical protein
MKVSCSGALAKKPPESYFPSLLHNEHVSVLE